MPGCPFIHKLNIWRRTEMPGCPFIYKLGSLAFPAYGNIKDPLQCWSAFKNFRIRAISVETAAWKNTALRCPAGW